MLYHTKSKMYALFVTSGVQALHMDRIRRSISGLMSRSSSNNSSAAADQSTRDETGSSEVGSSSAAPVGSSSAAPVGSSSAAPLVVDALGVNKENLQRHVGKTISEIFKKESDINVDAEVDFKFVFRDRYQIWTPANFPEI